MLPYVRHTIILIVTALSVMYAQSQQTEFRVTHYDETTGLESNVINAMLQDSKGYVWFGTADGLCRYDGYHFKTFRKIPDDKNSLPGNFVLKLTEDREGKIWMGFLKDGISSYDPVTGIFKNYDVVHVDTSKPLARAVTMLFTDKENNVWAGLQQKGLVKLDRVTGKFSQYNIIADTDTFYSKEFRGSYNNVYAMYEEGHGIYWLATHDGLYRFDARTAEMLPVRAKPLVKNMHRDDLFNTMMADKDGLWLGAWTGGISHYVFATKQWSNHKFDGYNSHGATNNIISDIKPKNANECWITSIDKGFGIFNTATRRFNFLSDSSMNPSIPHSAYIAVMEDKQHNIWLCNTEGLFKIKTTEKRFIHVPVKVSRSDNGRFYGTSCMLEDREGKFLITGTTYADGLHITRLKTGETRTVAIPLMRNEEHIMEVTDLMEDSKGAIWVLTRDDVYQLDPEKNRLLALPQPSLYMNDIRSNVYTVIKEGKDGRIWIASARNGIFCYHPEEKKYTHFYSDPANKKSLPSNVITALAIDKRGRVWTGGTRGCFGYFENTSGDFINLDRYGKRSAYNSDNRIYTLVANRNGDILAGTDAGLYYYDAHTTTPQLLRMFTAENGLRGDATTVIKEDGKGGIWCITPSSLCKINLQSGSILTLGKQDGIDKVNFLSGLFLFRTGKMAAFAVEGYYVFDPLWFMKKDARVPAVITSFKIDNKEQFFENDIALHKKPAVPADANVISFEFAALDFDRPDKQQYAYMLEGFDKNWVSSGQRRYAGYANIPGGDYVFKVKATNRPDDWNVPVAAIPIHVNQPFYKTWWFIVMVIAAMGTSASVLFRYKLRKQQQILQLETKAQILEKEKALTKYDSLKQQLNPHFLFNSLTSLSSLIYFDQEKAGDFLDGLSKMYRYILKTSQNETVPVREEIKFVQNFIRLQQTRFDRGLEVTIQIDEAYYDCKIVPVTFQNLIENAIKHNIIDKDSPLVIDIYAENEYIIVKNNQQKKNFVETSNKQGLANLSSLYNYLSVKPVIITSNEQHFFVKIPMI